MKTFQRISLWRTVFIFALFVFTLSACAPSGIARAPEGTLLRKIQERGKLVVGVKYDLPTIGYFNAKTNNVEGFEPAIAREIAAYIFGDPTKIEFKESVTADRIPFLQNGTTDLVIATFTINDERKKQIDFSSIYLLTDTRLLVPTNSSIRSVADLQGKRVAVNKGSSTLDIISKTVSVEFLLVSNTAEGTQAVLNKQADALAGDDIALYGLLSVNPGLSVVGSSLASQPLGIGVAKGNPELLEVVNTVIRNLKTSGKWKELWKKEIGDKVGIQTLPDPPPDTR